MSNPIRQVAARVFRAPSAGAVQYVLVQRTFGIMNSAYGPFPSQEDAQEYANFAGGGDIIELMDVYAC